MSDRRPEGPGDQGEPAPKPVPRDMPDQQADAGEGPWTAAGPAQPSPAGQPDTDVPDTDVPDTDEAGTGRRGAPHSGNRRPGHPVPDESSA